MQRSQPRLEPLDPALVDIPEGLLITWWAAPLDRTGMNVYGTFDQRDIVPISYAMVGFVLGIGAGRATRRTQAAIAMTLVTFVALRLCLMTWIRPDLVSPQVLAIALGPNSTGYGSSSFAWALGGR